MASVDIPANGRGGSATRAVWGIQVTISEKERFRRDARAARQQFVAGLDSNVRTALLQAIAGRAAASLNGAAIVASYCPMGHEVDPAPCVVAIGAAIGNVRIVLPWFASREASMGFRDAGGPLEPGPFGTMQPQGSAPSATPDILLVPLVAADLQGNRIGQGKGHFDRLLAALRSKAPVKAIGLAWDVQVFDRLPTDSWDQRLDIVITPTRTISV